MDSLRTAIVRTLAGSVAIGAVVGVMFAARETASAFPALWLVSTMYSVSIGVPATLVFRWMRPRLSGRPELRQWVAYVGALLAITLAGSLVTGLALIAIGLWPVEGFWANYVGGVEIALAITVPFTAGAVSLSRLRRERERAMALAAEARLASLESRVRPHFLFNALNSAIALIPEDPARAEQVLERLASLLRFSLDATHARLVPLGEELRVVRDYLEIERVRFGDRLRYELDVPDELLATPIPAFGLQTLVENSVKYAVAARTTGATIHVRVRRDGARLALDVGDDGPGFTGEPWRPGHGLDGLRARLVALYGARARLVAPAEAPAGARVTIELPAEAA